MGLILFLFFLFPQSHAEYRVFHLRITKTAPPTEAPTTPDPAAPPATETEADTGSVRYVLSNLDPVQYRGYYPVGLDEKVEYIKTWICPGRTSDFKSFCPDPHPPAEP